MAERERETRSDRVHLEGGGRTDLDRVRSGLAADSRDVGDREDLLTPTDLAGATGQPVRPDLNTYGVDAGDRHVDGSFFGGVVVSRGTWGTERMFDYSGL
jgi:hypothetical protein